MTYMHLIRRYTETIPVFVEMFNGGCLRVKRTDDDVHLWVRLPKSKDALEFIMRMDDESFMVKLEILLCMEALGGGPKIFRPTSEQMFALENMKLNLNWTDFATPYKLVIIELPEEYRKARTADGVVLNVYHDPAGPFFAHSVMNRDDTVYKTWWAPPVDEEMEAWFAEDVKLDMGEIPVQLDERESELLMRRAALNYCLLLDEVGVKSDGPALPTQYTNLIRIVSKNREGRRKHGPLLQAQPMLFSLKRPTELVRVVGNASELPAGETGRVMSPHSRRGHYRMQPCGPKNLERKRIRIPPTIVNKYLLLGGFPSASYKT